MTMHNSLHTGSAAHAVLSALDGRLALSGQIARGGSGPLDIRTGVMWPSGGFQVTGTSSTSPWQYSVPGATFVTSKGSLDGARLGSNDGVYLASTVPPPASNSRYDVVYVMQQDADATISPDGTTAPLITVYNGPTSASPSRSAALAAIPAGALALADFLVPSTATAGTADAAITATQDFLWTTTRGAPIPVRNSTEEAAITWGTATEPAYVWRLDTGALERNTGGSWQALEAAWATYVPVLGGITLGNGSLSGRWSVSGGVLEVAGKITFGSTTSITGAVTVSTPLTLATGSGAIPLGVTEASHSGSAIQGMVTVYSATAVTFVTSAGAAVSSTVPVTWAAGDVLGWRARCELA